jgi:hypothetical protein
MTHAFKVGMEVFIDRNQYGSKKPMQLCTVEKVTATQFTAWGKRFKVSGDMGRMVGDGYYDRTRSLIATPEMKAANALTIKRRDAEAALDKIATLIGRLRDDEAVAALDLLPQSIKDKVTT